MQTSITREGRFPGPFVLSGTPEEFVRFQGKAYEVAPLTQAVTQKPKQTREEQTAARNAAAIADLMASGGIVAKGAWQTGTGNYKKARAVPAGATLYTRNQSAWPETPSNVRSWFSNHPRAQACVAVDGV